MCATNARYTHSRRDRELWLFVRVTSGKSGAGAYGELVGQLDRGLGQSAPVLDPTDERHGNPPAGSRSRSSALPRLYENGADTQQNPERVNEDSAKLGKSVQVAIQYAH